MPLYEYTCSTCADDFTLLQSIHVQPGETACPSCGGKEVAKRLSVFAPHAGGAAPAPMGGCAPMGGGCGVPQGGGCGGGMCGL